MLDEKLNTILNNFERLIETQGSALGSDNGTAIAEIKQAFADAGGLLPTEVGDQRNYQFRPDDKVHVGSVNTVIDNDESYMTGKEWFERFEKETEGVPFPAEAHDAMVFLVEGAKRASGIEP